MGFCKRVFCLPQCRLSCLCAMPFLAPCNAWVRRQCMGAEPRGAPLRPKAPLWVDRWLGGRVAIRSPKILHVKKRENVSLIRGRKCEGERERERETWPSAACRALILWEITRFACAPCEKIDKVVASSSGGRVCAQCCRCCRCPRACSSALPLLQGVCIVGNQLCLARLS